MAHWIHLPVTITVTDRANGWRMYRGGRIRSWHQYHAYWHDWEFYMVHGDINDWNDRFVGGLGDLSNLMLYFESNQDPWRLAVDEWRHYRRR